MARAWGDSWGSSWGDAWGESTAATPSARVVCGRAVVSKTFSVAAVLENAVAGSAVITKTVEGVAITRECGGD